MSGTQPQTDLDPRYGSPGATATPWPEALARLKAAELYWLSTVRPDGRPHVTPLLGVWQDGALHFTTGARERKALNLAGNPHVVLTTGTNTWAKGYDLVVEGEAVRVTDDARLRDLAKAWEEKYGAEWHFDVSKGAFQGQEGPSFVFTVAPRTAFGFGKGEPFSQTRWRFQ
ncbi:pyridoxamine 5'-phosphate oxidase [Streptomyces albiflavescens]|uniref:Pyridoxamine 5'-phosphate oxidase n=1 Tax=Streptomyces albiflavescens TaxID=1623582 RepID=A0A917YD69_9ACTN|nr:pyridoxamine 5'-phosphate oxidase family protein [Streptomyces albiflavescens]GGN84677.1 pyridoxamine 5'-phosphate oxidase [Streptomyces albiflavescens]